MALSIHSLALSLQGRLYQIPGPDVHPFAQGLSIRGELIQLWGSLQPATKSSAEFSLSVT